MTLVLLIYRALWNVTAHQYFGHQFVDSSIPVAASVSARITFKQLSVWKNERFISLSSAGFGGQCVLKAASVCLCACVGGVWGRLDGVRQDVGEDLLEQDYPTIFGESADWSSDHS